MYVTDERTSGTYILVRFAIYTPDISVEGTFSRREGSILSEIVHRVFMELGEAVLHNRFVEG